MKLVPAACATLLMGANAALYAHRLYGTVEPSGELWAPRKFDKKGCVACDESHSRVFEGGEGSSRVSDERRARHAGSMHSKCGRLASFQEQVGNTRLHSLLHSGSANSGDM